MKWIDLADDETKKLEELQKENPGFEPREKPIPKVNWRSEDLRWRVSVNDLRLPEDQRTWNVWDMRGVEEPWGPRPKGFPTGKFFLLAGGIRDFRRALLLAELAAMSPKLRLALHAVGLTRHMIEQAKTVLRHERTH